MNTFCRKFFKLWKLLSSITWELRLITDAFGAGKNRYWDRAASSGRRNPRIFPTASCLVRNNNGRSINTPTYLYMATGNAWAGHSNVKPVSFVTRSPTSFTDGNWGLVLDAGSKNRTLDSPICTKPTAPGYFKYAGIGFVPSAKIDGRFCVDNEPKIPTIYRRSKRYQYDCDDS